MPSSKIASDSIQVYRLSKKINDPGGDNSFISGSSGGIRTGVLINYQATDEGHKRKDGRVLPAPAIETYHVEVVNISAVPENGKSVNDLLELVSESGVTADVSIVQKV